MADKRYSNIVAAKSRRGPLSTFMIECYVSLAIISAIVWLAAILVRH